MAIKLEFAKGHPVRGGEEYKPWRGAKTSSDEYADKLHEMSEKYKKSSPAKSKALETDRAKQIAAIKGNKEKTWAETHGQKEGAKMHKGTITGRYF
jgi:hypothetical protein